MGLDANYRADIERSPAAFDSVVEYHADGVAFWQRHGKHHPFLLKNGDGYTGDGKLYHENFAKIVFTPEDAGRVSFVELLTVPTIGGSELAVEDLDPRHLVYLDALIGGNTRRNVFLSDKVIRLMRQSGRQSGRFRWLPKPIPNQVLPELHRVGATTVYQYLHFSNFGIFQKRMTMEAAAISALAAAKPKRGLEAR